MSSSSTCGSPSIAARPVTGSRRNLVIRQHTEHAAAQSSDPGDSVLAEIETLGADLLEVRPFTPDCESPEPGDI
jgi:hypothetical protein